MKIVTDWLVYLLVRLVTCFIQAMPLSTGYRFASVFGQVAYKLDRRHRKIAFDNIKRAFPGQYGQAKLERLVRSVYHHFARIIVEIAHIPRLFRDTTWERYIHLRDRELMAGLLAGERSVLLVTAHYGNWEMAGYIVGMFGFKPYSVARTMDNRYLERLIQSFRTKTGQRIIYKRGAFDQVSAVIQKGFPVCLLSDQDAGRRGAFVEFMGQPASSHRGPAVLALEHDAIICMGFGRRIGSDFRYEVWIDAVIDSRDYCAVADPVLSITQECARAVERAVRLSPDQYFWLHRRWKHQPPSNVEQAA